MLLCQQVLKMWEKSTLISYFWQSPWWGRWASSPTPQRLSIAKCYWERWAFTVHTQQGFSLLNDQRQEWVLWHLRDSCHSSLVLRWLEESCQLNKLLGEWLARLSWQPSCFEHFMDGLRTSYCSCNNHHTMISASRGLTPVTAAQAAYTSSDGIGFSHNKPWEPVPLTCAHCGSSHPSQDNLWLVHIQGLWLVGLDYELTGCGRKS